MDTIKSKALSIFSMGEGIVKEEEFEAVMEELANYNGVYRVGTRMNGLVAIHKRS
ncbi:hypothetical protein [Salisediminibacterium halotolerans]|uniref:hypothetical protein n=1 Tax=Salisediminibacterium halotolerans TaxID=517425 RepID=UPI000F1ED031|nr:hypothetical protein [Salisediminibacterium halotolerans]RLJ73130.1 hypothetical protein BCL39_1878 [Actinophytocola xinjiangensis]RPE86552.1 hypothetical protein EDD67_2001 [Salisediminibacterium halotolerans]TWG33927.1 hypothetical protein BCL52_1875 [Salisediminibacterium halotolerans]GEL08674.1 hypothetical protein SHA02_20900 [Salisediminibacterium halotolerans]